MRLRHGAPTVVIPAGPLLFTVFFFWARLSFRCQSALECRRHETTLPLSLYPSSTAPLDISLDTEHGLVATPASVRDDVLRLFDACAPAVRRCVRSCGITSDVADDIVQETFVALFQHLRKGGSRENLRGWVMQVGYRLALEASTGRGAAGTLAGPVGSRGRRSARPCRGTRRDVRGQRGSAALARGAAGVTGARSTVRVSPRRGSALSGDCGCTRRVAGRRREIVDPRGWPAVRCCRQVGAEGGLGPCDDTSTTTNCCCPWTASCRPDGSRPSRDTPKRAAPVGREPTRSERRSRTSKRSIERSTRYRRIRRTTVVCAWRLPCATRPRPSRRGSNACSRASLVCLSLMALRLRLP